MGLCPVPSPQSYVPFIPTSMFLKRGRLHSVQQMISWSIMKGRDSGTKIKYLVSQKLSMVYQIWRSS